MNWVITVIVFGTVSFARMLPSCYMVFFGYMTLMQPVMVKNRGLSKIEEVSFKPAERTEKESSSNTYRSSSLVPNQQHVDILTKEELTTSPPTQLVYSVPLSLDPTHWPHPQSIDLVPLPSNPLVFPYVILKVLILPRYHNIGCCVDSPQSPE